MAKLWQRRGAKMELNRKRRAYNWLNSKRRECGQGQNRTADTRIFSPLLVARLCVTIGRYWYRFKRLTVISAGRFYRFEHIVAYSSGKVVAKSGTRSPKVVSIQLLNKFWLPAETCTPDPLIKSHSRGRWLKTTYKNLQAIQRTERHLFGK